MIDRSFESEGLHALDRSAECYRRHRLWSADVVRMTSPKNVDLQLT